LQYYAGLDIHKKTCQAIICTEKGDAIKQGKILTEKDKIQEFFSHFKNITIAIEACNTWEHIYNLLEMDGHHVVLAHPMKTRIIAESKIKTDKIDAKILMHLLRTGFLPTSYIPSKEIRELRHLVRQRIFLGRYSTKLKNKIYAELLRRGIQYETGGVIFTGKGRKWLRSLYIPVLDTYLSLLESLLDETAEIEKNIRMQSRKYSEIHLLTTIPGIGIYSAMIILSEIGDINRFTNEEKLYSYAGLTPSVHQSGENTYYGHITKRGSKHLRWILTEAVRVHLIWTKKHTMETKVSKYYYRLSKKKPENVAAIAAARKLLQIIYHMLKNKNEFKG
jgi:transposase